MSVPNEPPTGNAAPSVNDDFFPTVMWMDDALKRFVSIVFVNRRLIHSTIVVQCVCWIWRTAALAAAFSL